MFAGSQNTRAIYLTYKIYIYAYFHDGRGIAALGGNMGRAQMRVPVCRRFVGLQNVCRFTEYHAIYLTHKIYIYVYFHYGMGIVALCGSMGRAKMRISSCRQFVGLQNVCKFTEYPRNIFTHKTFIYSVLSLR